MGVTACQQAGAEPLFNRIHGSRAASESGYSATGSGLETGHNFSPVEVERVNPKAMWEAA